MSEIEYNFEVGIVGQLPASRALVFATGKAGYFWARGVDLGAQIGTVTVNGEQVGSVFTPKWANAVVVLSETLTRLPLDAMYIYTDAILEVVQPARTFILDSYSNKTYMTSNKVPFDRAPIRYISTHDIDDISSHAELFAAPNSITTTSAAILAILAARKEWALLVLLPVSAAPQAAPEKILPSGVDFFLETEYTSPHVNMDHVKHLLAAATEELIQ